MSIFMILCMASPGFREMPPESSDSLADQREMARRVARET